MTSKLILVTGASGYIGGRLVPQLLAQGYRVRCMARDPERLRTRDWASQVEIVAGDVLDRGSLDPCLAGCGAAFYLVHSMAGGEGAFRERDRLAARNFADAAAKAGLERIIYLGGLGRRSVPHSKHLASRHEVGDVLRAGSVPATELRAAMIIGSGSASFEMLRALVSRLPVMVCPRWVGNRTQPIAIQTVLEYLTGCLEHPETAGQVYDIGGPDVLTYKEMMERYGALTGNKPYIVVVTVLTPRLSAYWANLVTPVPASLAFPIIEGLRSETVCEDDRLNAIVPVTRLSFEQAVHAALEDVRLNEVPTRWSNASLPRRDRGRRPFVAADFPIQDQQRVTSRAPARFLFDCVQRIGGAVGWYYADPLWKIRGSIDRAIGGVGLRRGRRSPVDVHVGDAIDFWRVAELVRGERLLLHAEMKVPGDAWLEFRVRPLPDGNGSELTQTAYFRPSPFWGRVYWNVLYPVHELIFRGMARAIARTAERQGETAGVSDSPSSRSWPETEASR